MPSPEDPGPVLSRQSNKGAASADVRARADACFATVGADPPPPCSTVTIDIDEVRSARDR